MQKKWEPIVKSAKKRTIIEEKIKEITRCIDEEFSSIENAGLLDGKAGAAIYYANLDLFENNTRHGDKIYELIEECFDSINNGLNNPTFSSGIAGILWSIYYLNDVDVIKTDNYFDEIMPYLRSQLNEHATNSNFDFLHGANGIGYYMLNCPKENNQATLFQLINHLKQKGFSLQDTICWYSFIDETSSKRVCNLSLSHGISSTIVFLSKFVIKFPENKDCKQILEHAVNFLISKKYSPKSGYKSIFPSFIDENNIGDNSRMAWCYGDLGNAVALYAAGTALVRKDFLDFSIEVMTHSAKRRELKENLISDAGICHGTAGLSLIFNRFYQNTQREEFKEASLYWLEETLKMSCFKDGYAGYKTLKGDKGWKNSLGMLEGIAGIGLVLISSISEFEPKWDECLLLS